MNTNITPWYNDPQDIIREAEQDPNFDAADRAGKAGEAALYAKLKEILPADWMVLYGVSVRFVNEEHEIDFLVIVPGLGIVNLECKNFKKSQIENLGASFVLQNGTRVNPLKTSIQAVQCFYNHAKEKFFQNTEWGIYARAVVFPLLNFTGDDNEFVDFSGNPILTAKDCDRLPEIIRSLLEGQREHLQEHVLHGRLPAVLSPENAEFLYSKYAIQGTSCAAFTNPGVATNQMVMDALLEQGQRPVLDTILNSPNQYLHITGSAGTGKTWVAMAAAKKFLENGQRVLYVCFNKALAFFLANGQPEQENFKIRHFDVLDQLCFDEPVTHDNGQTPAGMTVFEQKMLEKLKQTITSPDLLRFRPNVILIDEAQDFSAAKINFLGKLWNQSGKNDGKMIFFSDPQQNIYQPTSNAMQLVQEKLHPQIIKLTDNLRNTKPIFDKCSTLIDLTKTREPVPAGVPNIEKTLSMQEALREITKLLQQFPRSDFAVLTASAQRLSDIRINGCSFNSAVDAQAVRRWKSGKTAWKSTIHAFKGLEAPCVVLLIPQGAANPQNENNFLQYIGASRAQYQLVIYTITE